MATLTVGAGKDFPSIHAAVTAAHDNDVIAIAPGNYVNDFPPPLNKPLTLRGDGGFVNLLHDPQRGALSLPGILVIGSGDILNQPEIILENFDLSGAQTRAGNAAAIYYLGGDLTCRNSLLHHNQAGIRGGNSSLIGRVRFIDCEICANGTDDGRTHNMDLCANQLTLENTLVHDARGGHEVRSRCQNTEIFNSRLLQQNGTGTWLLDMPNAGNLLLQNSLLHKGANSANPTCLIAIGEEGDLMPTRRLIIQDNTIINDRDDLQMLLWNHSIPAKLSGNSLWNIKNLGSPVEASANVELQARVDPTEQYTPLRLPMTTAVDNTPPAAPPVLAAAAPDLAAMRDDLITRADTLLGNLNRLADSLSRLRPPPAAHNLRQQLLQDIEQLRRMKNRLTEI